MNITSSLVALLFAVSLLAAPAVSLPTQGDIDTLKARLENQDSVKDRYRLGVMYGLTQQWDAAIEAWRRILTNKQVTLPRAAKVKLVRSISIAHMRAGRVEKAWSWIELAYKRAPDDERVIAAREAIAVALAEQRKTRSTPGSATTTSGAPATPASVASAAPPPPRPAHTAAQIRAAFDAGEQAYREGLLLIEQASDPAVPEAKFTAAIKELEVAVEGDERKPRTLFFLGSAHLMRYDDAAKDLEIARDRLEESLKLDEDKTTLTNLAQVYGLLDQTDKQIALLERVIAMDDMSGDAHFRLAMAYDKSGRKDAAGKTFEHAKAAIRISPEYKKKFQGVLKNSKVAADVADIVARIIKDAEDDTLTDNKTEEYARLIQEMLSPDGSIKPAAFKNPDTIRRLVGSPEGQQLLDSPKGKKIREFLKTPAGQAAQERALHALAASASPGAQPASGAH